MEQNINLILELPSISKIYLSAKQILLASLGWIIFLTILGIINYLFLPTQDNITNLEAQKNNANIQLTAVTKETTLLMNKAEKLGIKLATSKAAQVESQQSLGFSQYLSKLAQFTPEGIELDEINFSNLNRNILLTGKALTETLLPEYFAKLNNNLASYNKKFTELLLQKEANRVVAFTLNTSKEEKKE